MRTIGFRSNVLFLIAAAVGLLASLGRAWYAPSPAATPEEARIGDVHGPVEEFFMRLSREFTTASGTTGWDAFSTTDTILVALVAVAVISALAALVRGIEQPARELLRLATFAMLGIVVVKLANTPDATGLVERRQGAWIALGVTGIMASSANTVYCAPLLRRKAGRSLYETPVMTAPPRSTVFDTPGSVTPESAERA
jgi:membrane protein implicated in regulation of membrane protease activity